MTNFFEPMLANGLMIMSGIVNIWLLAMLVSGLLATTALVLALLRRAPAVVGCLGSFGVVSGAVPVLVWLVFFALMSPGPGEPAAAPGAGRGFLLRLLPFLLVSLLPSLLASTALRIAKKREGRKHV